MPTSLSHNYEVGGDLSAGTAAILAILATGGSDMAPEWFKIATATGLGGALVTYMVLTYLERKAKRKEDRLERAQERREHRKDMQELRDDLRTGIQEVKDQLVEREAGENTD